MDCSNLSSSWNISWPLIHPRLPLQNWIQRHIVFRCENFHYALERCYKKEVKSSLRVLIFGLTTFTLLYLHSSSSTLQRLMKKAKNLRESERLRTQTVKKLAEREESPDPDLLWQTPKTNLQSLLRTPSISTSTKITWTDILCKNSKLMRGLVAMTLVCWSIPTDFVWSRWLLRIQSSRIRWRWRA